MSKLLVHWCAGPNRCSNDCMNSTYAPYCRACWGEVPPDLRIAVKLVRSAYRRAIRDGDAVAESRHEVALRNVHELVRYRVWGVPTLDMLREGIGPWHAYS